MTTAEAAANFENSVGIVPPAFRMPGSIHIGKVRVGISNLERSTQFYRDVIGLRELPMAEAAGRVRRFGAPGSDEVLLELEELPGVQPIGRRTRLGLYHFAVLIPTRGDLAEFVRHLQRIGVGAGSADHLVSEALYLVDPDGLTVEVYADRPRSQWTYRDRQIAVDVQPLGIAELLSIESQHPWNGVPAGTTIGHIHLYVGDLQRAERFYHTALGFDKVSWDLQGALFVSAGGYHHHIGLNVWAAGSPSATQRDSRLLEWQLMLPDEATLNAAITNASEAGYAVEVRGDHARVIDPWGIVLVLAASNSRP
jgi:catechol 2,3-dioxygenase